MEVLSPYLAAFWTIAGLHKRMCQYDFERKHSRGDIIAQLRCEIERKSPAIHAISSAAHPPQIWMMIT
jgi:hypothetical protein